jgi:glucan biosynthesis protein
MLYIAYKENIKDFTYFLTRKKSDTGVGIQTQIRIRKTINRLGLADKTEMEQAHNRKITNELMNQASNIYGQKKM